MLRAGAVQAAIAVGAVAFVVGALLSGGTAGAQNQPRTDYYVSIGDSYAAGYQPLAIARHHRDSNGFAYQLVTMTRTKGYRFTLKNFACDGATTTSVVTQVGCSMSDPGPDDANYPNATQEAAAAQFITRHKGDVGLITVSIGGNDILACGTPIGFTSCVADALSVATKNLLILLSALRTAAGPTVPIVGTTYPDIFLGFTGSKNQTQRRLAVLSVAEFRTQLNPALRSAYQAVDGSFVDVTKATGGYLALSDTEKGAHHSRVPVAVAKVCSLTYFCTTGDVHPTAAGYAVIARLIAATLPVIRRTGINRSS
jgi:lysophospholipase L1-like esterase